MEQLQKLLKENGIKYYIIPTDDDHQSEMVGEYYQFRKYISSFTGSAGTLIVGQNEAYLWTDGRYFIQAKKQLRKGIKLMKMGVQGVPTIQEFLIEHLDENDVIGFDAKVMKASFILDLQESLDFNLKFIDTDFTSIWKNRPPMSHEPLYLYDEKYHGRSTVEKLKDIREFMHANDCQFHLVSSLDDIAWIFNIRGNDIAYSPVVLAFALITRYDATLYLQKEAYTKEIKEYFESIHVHIKDYDLIYKDIKNLGGTILCDLNSINYALFDSINAEIVNTDNPSQYFKAIKNSVEIENTKKAHLKDGIAVTKFMYWFKNREKKTNELEAQEKLLSFRQAQENFIEPSFATICAYGKHGAIIHYQSSKRTNVSIEDQGLLMIDSGGHYLEGTTDITRTFVCGKLTDIEKRDFTIVLKGFLQLMNAHFLYGTTGQNLDMLARAPLARYGLDFKHGTGHGIGHLLNVHEGPQNIRPRPFNDDYTPFEVGMITSDEPGVYVENSHGIRHENELLCVYDQKTEHGQFMKFEPLTIVPIDIDGIDITLLNSDEIKWLNEYHQFVYDTLSPYLEENEKEWLAKYTKAL